MKGYKVFGKRLRSWGYQFEVGKEFEIEGELKICENGFHFCKNLIDCFKFYPFSLSIRACEVEAVGEFIEEKDKIAAAKIKIIREVPMWEIDEMCNDGEGNIGIGNKGNFNNGNCNKGSNNNGNHNEGNSNKGNSNKGNCNKGSNNNGNHNEGNSNKGNFNNGNCNKGSNNNGNHNEGNSNKGNFNNGNCNEGNSNKGNFNNGNCNKGSNKKKTGRILEGKIWNQLPTLAS